MKMDLERLIEKRRTTPEKWLKEHGIYSFEQFQKNILFGNEFSCSNSFELKIKSIFDNHQQQQQQPPALPLPRKSKKTVNKLDI